MFSIRPERDPQDRVFIEALNPRLTEVIDAPTHSDEEIRAFQSSFTATAWDHGTARNATFVAEDEDHVRIGYINVREGTDDVLGEPCGYIALLVVEREHEGKGVAQALIRQAEEWAIEASLDRMALDVFASNERALDFYGRAGFAPETVRVVKKLEK